MIRRKYVTACLKKSIAAKRLEVWYQPVYDNLEKAFISAKALITLKALIDLFHSLDMKIIAEGIETEDQNRLLLELGADRIQGFYYARPMPQSDLILFLQEQKKCSSHNQEKSQS